MYHILNIKIITSWRKWRKTLNDLRYFLVKAKGAAVICDNTFFWVNSFSYF